MEFSRICTDEEHTNICMTMPGGGYHKTAPGQITDDSELSMCLMKGLIESNRGKQPGEVKVYDYTIVGE